MLEGWLFQNLTLYSAGILLALYSGMRLGACCTLRWSCYDPARGELHIRETVRRVSEDSARPQGKKTRLVYSEPKTASSRRTLALPDILLDLLDLQYRRFTDTFGQAPAQEDFILYNAKGGAMDPDNLSHYFGDVLAGLGLPHVKYHAMRHPYVKHTTKKYNSEKQKTQATKMDLIAWGFCFCIVSYSKRSWTL